MKFFLLFFMFFLGLSSFTAGWILRGQYRIAERENHKVIDERENDTLHSQDTLMDKTIKRETVSEEKNILSKEEKLQNTKQTIFTEKTDKPPVTENSKETSSENVLLKEKPQDTKQSVLEKKDTSSREEKYLQFNKKEFAKIEDQQSFFSKKGQYSFLINVFSEEKSAFAYIEKLKKRFPVWNFFIRPDKVQLRVYLGPFETKKEALKFIEKIPAPSPFPNYFLEKETFSLNEL